ncbi:protein TIFY 6a-like isoform X2 [Phalaenopsis equestris]|uniref:protein TIFY 6a-like isoform X1 n=1 Tax=Phalaenopsis equestris TaxID=78828 RepID=UPI0009E658D6|nr:protein TIFY 6a-like isoform X1 [Phalaenopsis equestris]XP_020584763.1 protein TIFY 6a-like isoform X2 [Phalaenopsis equestris]
MERDFLGVVGRNYRALAMEETYGGRLDSAFSVNMAVHWPFMNKASAMQKFKSFEALGEEDRLKKLVFEPPSSTGLQPATSIDAFEAGNAATSAVKASEKLIGMEIHGLQQFSIPSSQNEAADTHHASTQRYNNASFTAMSHSPSPITIAMTTPFMKSHSSSNLTATEVKQQPLGSIMATNPSIVTNGGGSFTPRNVSKLHMKTAPLTIFYAGSVNVYDDVPSHMAQTIMLMASKECKNAINAADDKTEMKSEHVKATNACMVGVPASATIMPRAVPQARKASLARFLEKRRERISNTIPYSCEKKSPNSSVVLESAPPSSKCSSPDASISSNRCGSWYVNQTKSCSDSDEFPSTKLEM